VESTALEATYKELERQLKHLWETISVVTQACEACFDLVKTGGAVLQPFRIKHIKGGGTAPMGRDDILIWLRTTSASNAYEWGLIVAITRMDAWLECLVTRLHAAHCDLLRAAIDNNFNFKRPSFNKEFLLKDQAGIGLDFDANTSLALDYVAIKETRNLLVHNNGRVTKRFFNTVDKSVAVGARLTVDAEYLRTSIATMLKLATDIRRQLRRHIKKRRRLATRT
jgi:hypothetical protein